MILVREGISLNAAAANNPNNDTMQAKSLLSEIITIISKINPNIANHSNHKRGSDSVNVFLISH